MTAAERLDALEARVTELESRLQEAGRRALFPGPGEHDRSIVREQRLADVGRALLFDTETPDSDEPLVDDLHIADQPDDA